MIAYLVILAIATGATAAVVLLIEKLPALYAKHADIVKDKRKHATDMALIAARDGEGK